MKTLGQSIRLLRKERDWSQHDVAKQLGISIPAFSKIETGVTDINLSRLEQISALFGMSTVELLNLNEGQQNTYANEMAGIYQKLDDRETQIIELQKKVIILFEELRLVKSSA
jgi:transcriptional regulator with XRE-family HTH domain